MLILLFKSYLQTFAEILKGPIVQLIGHWSGILNELEILESGADYTSNPSSSHTSTASFLTGANRKPTQSRNDYYAFIVEINMLPTTANLSSISRRDWTLSKETSYVTTALATTSSPSANHIIVAATVVTVTIPTYATMLHRPPVPLPPHLPMSQHLPTLPQRKPLHKAILILKQRPQTTTAKNAVICHVTYYIICMLIMFFQVAQQKPTPYTTTIMLECFYQKHISTSELGWPTVHSLEPLPSKSTSNVLRLLWNPLSDKLSLVPKKPLTTDNPLTTKRELLKESSKLYDPIGFTMPVTIQAKILIQKVWTQHIDWDEPLGTDLAKEWQRIAEDLAQLHQQSDNSTLTNSIQQKYTFMPLQMPASRHMVLFITSVLLLTLPLS